MAQVRNLISENSSLGLGFGVEGKLGSDVGVNVFGAYQLQLNDRVDIFADFKIINNGSMGDDEIRVGFGFSTAY